MDEQGFTGHPEARDEKRCRVKWWKVKANYGKIRTENGGTLISTKDTELTARRTLEEVGAAQRFHFNTAFMVCVAKRASFMVRA